MVRDGNADAAAAQTQATAEAAERSPGASGPSELERAWSAFPPNIGHYAIEGVIGTGGFGTVYRGVHRWLRVPGAIKVIQCEESDQLRADFRREAQRQARLQAHPGIAQVRDFGFFTDPRGGAKLPYYVMDLIPGNQSLTAYATHLGLSMNDRLRLFAQVCDAVQYAHDRGILHLDLKPANILVFPEVEGRPAQPKVIDFGIARAADPALERRVRAGVSGTIAYMSPEQTDVSIPLDVRSDVYSLGVVLYEMLTGWLPYEVAGRSAAEAYRVVREVPPDFESARAMKLPAPVRAILARALTKRAQERYQDVASLSSDIRTYLRGGVPAATGAGAAARVWSEVRRLIVHHPWLTAAAVLALTLLVTDRVGVPLIYRWTGTNAWFESHFARSAIDRFEHTIIVGRTDASNPMLGLEMQGPPGSAIRPVLAELMERFAHATGRPAAVVFDYTFRGQTGADERFAAAAMALEAAGVPVVIAELPPKELERPEDRGKPPLSPVIAGAISRRGRLFVQVDDLKQWGCPSVIKGPGPDPYVSLSMAAYAAATAPGKRPVFELDTQGNTVQIAFFDRSKPPGESLLEAPERVEKIRATTIQPVEVERKPIPGLICAYMHLPLPERELLDQITIPIESLVVGDGSSALARCAGRIVLVADLEHPSDTHDLRDGEHPGVHAHALAVESFWAGVPIMPSRVEEWAILAIGALAGMILPIPILLRRAWWPRWAVGVSASAWLVCMAVFLGAGVVAAWYFGYLFNPLVLVFAFLLAAALTMVVGGIRRSHPINREALT